MKLSTEKSFTTLLLITMTLKKEKSIRITHAWTCWYTAGERNTHAVLPYIPSICIQRGFLVLMETYVRKRFYSVPRWRNGSINVRTMLENCVRSYEIRLLRNRRVPINTRRHDQVVPSSKRNLINWLTAFESRTYIKPVQKKWLVVDKIQCWP